MSKLILSYVCLLFMEVVATAQEKIVRLFPEGAPGETVRMAEKISKEGNRVAGEVVCRVTNVSDPTIAIYQPSEELASGSAMIVCPGGGYDILAYDLEGDEVCLWLNELGITAVLLKYRVPRREGRPKHEAPLQDLQRAISYVRANASELNVDANRIGVMGFSAGAHLAVMASTSFNKRTYLANNVIDKVSCRPNFCLLIYPAYLDGEHFGLAPEIQIAPKTPPTMLIQTEDDRSFINSSLFYYYALKEANIPVWMHLYGKGGHGYGLRDTGVMVNSWPDRAEDWFREIGVIETE
ncbi:MAG: alpha/beta hydrolase [Tannerella sp.]|uniref:alpha/beta hydrolase n=1 Tax=Tannerella sp. TaxID=2382127 RepID=UPI003FA29F89